MRRAFSSPLRGHIASDLRPFAGLIMDKVSKIVAAGNTMSNSTKPHSCERSK
jgi:hypothetical protein